MMLLLLNKAMFLSNTKKKKKPYEKIPDKWQDLMWDYARGNGRETEWVYGWEVAM